MRQPIVASPAGVRLLAAAAILSLACCGGGGGTTPAPPSPPPPSGPTVTQSSTGLDGRAAFGASTPARTLEVLDLLTDAPIPGLDVWVAEDADHALALIQDPQDRYPPRVVSLTDLPALRTGVAAFTVSRARLIARNVLPQAQPRSIDRIDSDLFRFFVESLFLHDGTLTLPEIEARSDQFAGEDLLLAADPWTGHALAVLSVAETLDSQSVRAHVIAYREQCYSDTDLFDVFVAPLGGVLILPVGPPPSAPGDLSSVTGVVVAAESGIPIAGAQVHLSPWGVQVQTDAQGEFSLPAVPVPCGLDATVSLLASADGCLPSNVDVELHAPTTGPVRIELNPTTVDLTTWAAAASPNATGSAGCVAAAIDGLGRTIVAGDFSSRLTLDAGLAGERSFESAGAADIFLARIAPGGTVAMARRDGSTSSETVASVAAYPDGSAVVVGTFHGGSTVLGTGDATVVTLNAASPDVEGFVARYAADGQLLWARGLGGTDSDRCSDVAVRSDGSCIVVGAFRTTMSVYPQPGSPTLTCQSQGDLFVACFAANGVLQWLRHLATSGGNRADLGGVAVIGGTEVVMAGEINGALTVDAGGPAPLALAAAEGDIDGFLVRLDADGHPVWGRAVRGTGRSGLRSVAAHVDGSIAVAGLALEDVTFGPGETSQLTVDTGVNSAGFVARFDADGDFRWARLSSGATPMDLAALGDGATVAVGYFSNSIIWGAGEATETTLSTPVQGSFFAIHDADGDLRLALGSGGSSATVARGASTAPAGQFVAVGSSSGPAELPLAGTQANLPSGPQGIGWCLRRKGEAP